jgi:hypothetical protein
MDGRALLGEALEQRPPVPGAQAIELRGGRDPVGREGAGVDAEDARRRFEPRAPERSCVTEGAVEIDGDGAQERRPRMTRCQASTPAATPTASMATSSGEPCRPATNDWWTSSDTA